MRQETKAEISNIVTQTGRYIHKYRWFKEKHSDYTKGELKLQEILTWVNGRLDEIQHELQRDGE